MAGNLAPNASLTKVDQVMFSEALELFEDELEAASMINKRPMDPLMQQRSSIDGPGTSNQQSLGEVWRPLDMVGNVSMNEAITASDQSNLTQLAVPFVIDQVRTAALSLSFREGNDPIQLKRLLQTQLRQLSTEINKSAIQKLANYGSSVVTYNAAFDGYNALSRANTKFANQGITARDRMALLSADDYNTAAGSSLVSKQYIDKENVQPALRKIFLGEIASFSTYKAAVSVLLPAATGAANTIDLSAGSANHYVPKPSQENTAGSIQQTDNRFQPITLTSAIGTVKIGDCFTIGTGASLVTDVHMFAKTNSTTATTFRVVGLGTGSAGTTLMISPPIVSNAGSNSNGATQQYQNCNVPSLVANLPINWLNKTAAYANPFFDNEKGIELNYGRYPEMSNVGAGILNEFSPRLGIPVLFTKQADTLAAKINYTFRVQYGLTIPVPQACGIVLANQS